MDVNWKITVLRNDPCGSWHHISLIFSAKCKQFRCNRAGNYWLVSLHPNIRQSSICVRVQLKMFLVLKKKSAEAETSPHWLRLSTILPYSHSWHPFVKSLWKFGAELLSTDRAGRVWNCWPSDLPLIFSFKPYGLDGRWSVNLSYSTSFQMPKQIRLVKENFVISYS